MLKHVTLLLIILFLSSASHAQQLNSRTLDSLYYSVVRIRRPDLLRNMIQTYGVDTIHRKSATGLFNAVRTHLSLFNKEQREVIQSILDRPASDTSIVSPNGFFRIHYDVSGSDTPTYNINNFAIACDSVYNFEINNIGYPAPPSDNGEGGDDKFDVYIEDIGNSVYSYTIPETLLGPDSTYTSYIVINNNFAGFYTTGLNAAKVSIAHEFTHAIHIGDYVNRYFSGDEFFYELSATAMEHFIFPSIKDYLQYLPAYFDNTQNCFAVNGTLQEFGLAIWDIYLKDNFGYGILKKEWELMPQMRAMDAINEAIQQYGSSLGEELNKFAVWMYFTNYRTIPGEYFEDASYYPKVRPVSTLNFNSNLSVQLETGPVSSSFVTIINTSNSDTLVNIITNSDVNDAINNINSVYPFNFSWYDSPTSGALEITNNYYYEFSADNTILWTNAEILNNSLIESGKSLGEQITYAFPSPFNYAKNDYIYIPVTSSNNLNVQFNVYTIAMEAVFSSIETIESYNGQTVVKWNGRNSNNDELATGVYIYTLKAGSQKTIVGKLAIIN
jgi:hypothetical protein